MMKFCGKEERLFSIWVDGTFAVCFRELVIGNIPYLMLFTYGLWHLFRLFMLRKRKRSGRKKKQALDEPLSESDSSFISYAAPQLSQKTVLMRRLFWVKFVLCVFAAVIAAAQTLEGAISKADSLAPVVLLGNVLRLASWGICALTIYMEYKLSQPTSMTIRIFWILMLVTGIVKDVGFITYEFPVVPKTLFFWTFQISLVVDAILVVFGCLGFSSKLRAKLEPRLPEEMLVTDTGFSAKALISMFRPDWILWAVAFGFAVAHGVLTIKFLNQIGEVIKIISADPDDEDVGSLQKEMLIFSAYGVTAAIAALGNYVFHGIASLRLVSRLKRNLVSSLLIQEMAFFDSISVGALVSHLNIDTDKIGLIREILPWIINPICQVIAGAVELFGVSWELSMLLFGLLFFEFVEAVVRSKHVTYRFSKMYSRKNRDALERGTEILTGFKTVRLFGQEKYEKGSFDSRLTRLLRTAQMREFLESLCDGVETLLHAGVIVAGTLYCRTLVNAVPRRMDPDGVNQFVLVGVAMVTCFQEVIKQAPKLADAAGPASIVNSYINRMPLMESDYGETLDKLEGSITFESMDFKYPNGFSASFKDFELHVPAGTSMAFVGPSGCGKTTLFKLMQRFYDPEVGRVVIDDEHDLKELNLRWWLSQIGVVTQEPVLFKGTLRDNIMYGVNNPDSISDRDLMEAVQKAQLQSLVDEKGLDYEVGDRGGKLSGGQKQRVCIARVFLRKPKVIFLDEVTSALDPISEAEVIKALNELTKGRTTFTIAHRLHTITHVDRILVLRDGAIIDSGTHDELSTKPGFYQTMWLKQQKDEEEGGDSDDSGERIDASTQNQIKNLLDLVEQNTDMMPDAANTILNRLRPSAHVLDGSTTDMSDLDSDMESFDGSSSSSDDSDEGDAPRYSLNYNPPKRRTFERSPSTGNASELKKMVDFDSDDDSDDDDPRGSLLRDKRNTRN